MTSMSAATLLLSLAFGANAAAFDMLDVVLGEAFPADTPESRKFLHDMLPTDKIKVTNSGALAAVFPDYEVWVLNESQRRVAVVMASRVLSDLDQCDRIRQEIRTAIDNRNDGADYAFAETVETELEQGTGYVFSCRQPQGSPLVLLSFVVRNAEMGREFLRLSNEKIDRSRRERKTDGKTDE